MKNFRQTELKRIRKKVFECILLLGIIVGLVLTFDVGNITSKIVKKAYPEYTIENDSFGSDKAILKDFAVLENGALYSETNDPWIYVPFETNGYFEVFCVDIGIEQATNQGEQAQIYYVGSYDLETFDVVEEKCHINLTKLDANDAGLRFDLTEHEGQVIYVTNLLFNDNQYINTYVRNKIGSCTIALILFGVMYLAAEVRKSSKWLNGLKQVKLRNEASLMLFVLIMLLSIVGVWLPAFIFTVGVVLLHGFGGGIREKPFAQFIYLLLVLCFAYYMDFSNVWYISRETDRVIYMAVLILALLGTLGRGALCLNVMLFMGTYAYLQYALNDFSVGYFIREVLFGSVFALNLLMFIALVIVFALFFGKHLGICIFNTIYIIYFAANVIKVKFQNALISRADFGLLGEVWGIAGQFISFRDVIAVLCVIMLLLVLGIKFRKQIRMYLKPHFSKWSVVAAAGTGIFCWSILANCYETAGMNVRETYFDSKTQINKVGYGVYTLLQVVGGQNDMEPENYSKNIVDVMQEYDDDSTENEIKPTVILILAESLFEVEDIPDVIFNKELTGNLAPYKVTNLLSPIYGGRTAVAEFEALTGLSDLFIERDTVPYTAYLNKTGNNTGSVAREFGNNGYYTCAIHANVETYYSRNTAYADMGFDDFISIEDMSLNTGDYLADGLVSDAAFVNRIIEEAEQAEKPVFIFGASLEGHSPYLHKYESTDVTAYSDKYDEDVSSYAQSVYNFDQQMGRLIAYFEETGQPVLIYIFGDHRPPLKINELDGCLDDVWQKYWVPLYAYSNYCDTSISEEWISTNQIAPEILRKSGVSYNAYFDYIYSLRKNYPVIHKSVTLDLDNEELQLYNAIEWDLLFGRDYLLQ